MRAIEAITPKRYADGKLFAFETGTNGRAPGWRPNREFRKELGLKCRRSFVFTMQFGPGAGYCRWNDDRTKMLVRGRKLFVAWRSGSRAWSRDFRCRKTSGLGLLAWYTPLEIGLTRRARSIYLSH